MTRIVSLVAAMTASLWFSTASAEPAALVSLARAQTSTLHSHITAYGTVAPDPNGLSSITLSRDVVVTSVFVRAGQAVRAGDPIVAVRTAPNALAVYQQASSTLSFAQKDLAHTRELYAEQLATNSQLAAAIKALQDAKSALVAQQQIGAGTQSQTLRVNAPGVVTSISVSPGDRVPASTTIATIATHDRLIVDLGLEPSVAGRITRGNAVVLHPPQDASKSLMGRLQSVDGMLDPKSRLVNAVVSIDKSASGSLILGSVLQADIAVSSRVGVVVPHSALMTDAGGTYAFVVSRGVAHRRNIRIALDTGQRTLVAQGIKSGELVVIAGNAALEDGMHVRVH